MINDKINISLPYRIIREDETDQDIYIDADMNTVNMIIGDAYYINRIQFPLVKAIIIRATSVDKTVTVHLLRDIDLFSSFCNMDMDLSDKTLTLLKKDNLINLIVK